MTLVLDKNHSREFLAGGVTGFLQRRWPIIAVPLILLPLVSFFKALSKPPVFRSSVQLLVEESNLQSPLLDSYVLKMDLEAQLRTLEKTAGRPMLLDRVKKLLLNREEGMSPTEKEDLKSLVDLEVLADGTVRMSAMGSTPGQAYDLATAYQEVCANELNRPRVEAAKTILEFLTDELTSAQVNLDRSHLSLAEYRASHGKVLPELEAITYNLLLSLEAEQVDLDSRRHALLEQRAQLEGDPAVRGRTVAGLVDQIANLEKDVATAEVRMTGLHPELQKMKSRLARLQLDLDLRKQGLTPPGDGEPETHAEEEYRMVLIEQLALAERIAQVDLRVEELQQKIAAASGHDAAYVRRLRNVESHSEIYLDLVRRRERAATSLHLVQVNHGDLVRVIQAPDYPVSPESPRPLFDLVLGLAIGFVAGFGLAATAELMDQRVHSTRNLELALGTPTMLQMKEPT